jgi:putative addiction module component (TIGR02574 family)
MPREAAQILREALELPSEARAALADSLLDSLEGAVDPDAEQAWRDEIEQRVASLESGSVSPVAWEDVQARIARRLQR